MLAFLKELQTRNELLYWAGWVFLVASMLCLALVLLTNQKVLGINAWIKPFKFFLSSVLFFWSMGWYGSYLNEPTKMTWFSWMAVIVLAFEVLYIAFRASRGELSHFNQDSNFGRFMFGVMGAVVSFMTLWTAYIGILFFQKSFPDLPASYVWGIRIGIILFVIFAFQGGMMGARFAHTVGGTDGSEGLFILNWSRTFGDLRVAHFFGMHALQIVPLVSFFVLSKPWQVFVFSGFYLSYCVFVLYQALIAQPFIKLSQ